MRGPRPTALLCRVGTVLAALPLGRVDEVMRPLPVQPVAGAPRGVLGAAVVRGEATPVLDAASLLGGRPGARDGGRGRFVVVRASRGRAALLVDDVLGLGRPGEAASLPPLLQEANPDLLSALASLDAELLAVLDAGRLLPDEAWDRLGAAV